jgi:hypothetical protein
MVANTNAKITVHDAALWRKAKCEALYGATFHTVIFDDHAVFNARGDGRHDDSQRVIYYRRGAGSYRARDKHGNDAMHRCGSVAELKKLLAADEGDLPAAARMGVKSDYRDVYLAKAKAMLKKGKLADDTSFKEAFGYEPAKH